MQCNRLQKFDYATTTADFIQFDFKIDFKFEKQKILKGDRTGFF